MEDVTSCQFFLPGLYAIKVIVVVYSVLAYNIVFFKIVFNVFLRSRFSKTFLSNVTGGSNICQYCP